ncbi:MAG TPA: T9SS type A sorting domain-containing protein [bacterium]|nr:T9SS type A sorting domain-containing protein [bacterium]
MMFSNDKKLVHLFAAVVFGLFFTAVVTTEAAEIERTGQWPNGQASTISVQDSAIYLGHGGFLSVFHTRTFAQISQFAASGYIRNIAISGKHAFVAAAEAGLYILDLSNPAHLQQVARITEGTIFKVAVQGNYAYLATGASGLRIVDVSKPNAPNTIMDYLPESTVEDVAVDGHYAYLACAKAGLCVVDIQNPAAPNKVLTYATDVWIHHVAASSGTVFLIGNDLTRAVNFSSVSQPQEMITINGSIVDVAFQGPVAYLVNETENRVNLHDLADASLKILGDIGDMYSIAVAVQSDKAYVAEYNSGFETYDVSDPARPASYGKWKSDKVLLEPFMVGDFMACPVLGENELRFYDVKDMVHPQRVTTANIRISSYEYNAPYLYYTTDYALRTCNLTDIYNPLQESPITLSQKSNSMFRQGDTLMVWDTMGNSKGFDLYSLVDPQTPKKLATIQTETAVSVQGKKGPVVYLNARTDPGSNEGTLYGLDITNPAAPVKGGEMVRDTATGFYVHGRFGIADTKTDSVLIFDLSQPLQPKRVSAQYDKDYADPHFVGSLLYCTASGVTVYDVTDMTRWHKLSSLNQVDYYTGTLFHPPFIVKPTLNNDVYVFDISGKTSGTRLGNVDCIATIDHLAADGHNLYALGDKATLTRLKRENGTLTVTGSRTFLEYGTSHLAGMQIIGNRGYVAEEYYGHMHEIDLTSADLDIVRTCYLGNDRVYSFAISWPYACVRSTGGFRIYDISQAEATLLSTTPDSDTYYAKILIKGNYACLNGLKGIDIYDIANPAVPVHVGAFAGNVIIYDMALSGDYLYLTNPYNAPKIQVVNISNPLTPVAAGEYNKDIYCERTTADGNYLYACCQYFGLQALDLSAPAAPVLAGRYAIADLEMSDVTVSGNQIFVLDKHRGVLQLQNNLMTAVPREEGQQPAALALLPNYPNPFNASTAISFTLPREERVTVSVYNVLGQQVARLLDGKRSAGRHNLIWHVDEMPTGLYFCRFTAGSFRQTRRMLLLR